MCSLVPRLSPCTQNYGMTFELTSNVNFSYKCEF